MEFPKFSVLMSVYANDNEQQLSQALQSVFNQTLLPDELVIVQDGPVSTQIINCIKTFDDMDLITIINVVLTKNVGLGEALKTGSERVRNNWIARMDSDDINKPERFEKQMSYIRDHPDISVLGTQLDEFSGNTSNLIGKRTVPCENNDIKNFAKTRSPFNHPTVVVKKGTLFAVGGYVSFAGMEDYHLWTRILTSRYKVHNLSESLLYMRTDQGMYSRRGGFKYLASYFKLKKLQKKLGLINLFELLYCNLIMTISTLMPTFLRQFVYKKVLHK